MRMTTVKGPPESFDDGVKVVTGSVIPAAQKIPGFKGGTWFGDRSSGRMIGVTFWASEEELKASRQQVDKLRADAVTEMGGEVVGVEEFEVVAQA